MRQKNLYCQVVEDGFTRVFGPCTFTGIEYSCKVPTAGLQRYLDGELIQNALPQVSADDREFLMSGISPTGWTKTFG